MDACSQRAAGEMAVNMEIDWPPEIERQLQKMAKLDDIAPAMLNAASPIVVTAVKNRLQPHSRTGALVRSVAASAAKAVKNGFSCKIHFAGYDTSKKGNKKGGKGVANAVKAAGLEYGNAHEAPRPFLTAAKNDARDAVADKMQQVFNNKTR